MDEDSKALLKRDVFVQGLLLKWQKKESSNSTVCINCGKWLVRRLRQFDALERTSKAYKV